MAKKGKKVATPKLSPREQKVAEDLAAVQEIWSRLTLAMERKEEREWVLVPIATPKIESQEAFAQAVANTRTEIRGYVDWEEARNAARDLSDAGGIQRVFILSVKRISRIDLIAQFVDGSAAKKGSI